MRGHCQAVGARADDGGERVVHVTRRYDPAITSGMGIGRRRRDNPPIPSGPDAALG